MKIAITADLHLTNRKDHPERFHALENILEQIREEQISTLIIAGDLFDEASRNYAEFDQLCSSDPHAGIAFFVIPGNHDAFISEAQITAKNVKVITQPVIESFEPNLQLLFLPYKKETTMGEKIAGVAADLVPNEWILISHGDWSEGIREPNPFEPGVYMPLTRTDLDNFKPAEVLLGHIHKPMDAGRVHYVGSPCGLNSLETGRRRFLVLDTETRTLQSKIVETDFIYFNVSLIVLPLKDERAYLEQQIANEIEKWGLAEAEKPRVRLQVKVRGYTADKRALQETIGAGFRHFKFYKNRRPDLAEVSTSEDQERGEIAERVSAWIEKVSWPARDPQPTKAEALLQALHVIYGD
ncbi:MAG: exonuclease SbcCD subunit D [bacterium]